MSRQKLSYATVAMVARPSHAALSPSRQPMLAKKENALVEQILLRPKRVEQCLEGRSETTELRICERGSHRQRRHSADFDFLAGQWSKTKLGDEVLGELDLFGGGGQGRWSEKAYGGLDDVGAQFEKLAP